VNYYDSDGIRAETDEGGKRMEKKKKEFFEDTKRSADLLQIKI